MSINALPPFQYSLDSPHLNMTKVEKNRVIWTDIINSKISLGMKMVHYKTHFLHTSEDGFIIKPPYMDICLSYALRSVIVQMRPSSHQLQIEVVRYTRIPLEERVCQLYHIRWKFVSVSLTTLWNAEHHNWCYWCKRTTIAGQGAQD